MSIHTPRTSYLVHGLRVHEIAPERPDNSDVLCSSQLLAHIAPINGGAQIVHNPIRTETLAALVCVAWHLELEVPLMRAGVDFMGLVLGSVQGKYVQSLGEKLGLAHDRLGRHS